MGIKHYQTEENAIYSEAVVDGDMIYLSGLVTEEGDIVAQTAQILDDMADLLKKYGSDMSKVLRVDVLLTDFSERDIMNAEYIKHWPKGCIPARICYGTSGLHGECKVEMIAIAKK